MNALNLSTKEIFDACVAINEKIEKLISQERGNIESEDLRERIAEKKENLKKVRKLLLSLEEEI